VARLAQAISNLLNNAAKYTDDGGEIQLRVDVEDAQAVIRVKDNGIGIAGDDLARVFDLFQQSDRALDRAQGGLGIGLTIVKKLVEMHGGRVEASSEGVGRGSEFVLHLTLAATGDEGLALALREKPEVGLIDIGLPGMSGYEVARAIRRNQGVRQIVLIALTGWGAQSDLQQSHEAGFDQHLTKPVSLEALEQALAAAARTLP